jgi:hypothetical protein
VSHYDPQADAERLLARVNELRSQVLEFIRELDRIGVLPGFLPAGAVEALADADAALGLLAGDVAAGEATVAEIDRADVRLDDVEGHIREIQQELWKAAVKQRPR